ncbi:major capsid protein [Microvirus mar20]|uniref:Major capsid protein n=1 Tax=Microvirus mar20 TaxID=2851153 RepID=A0A8F5MIT8_9VIRU|nr:major capsid protein [Microvirus mar20]
MNRNANSHFALNPTDIDISRSKFDRNASVKFSGNVGDIIPFYVDEVLPGDTFQIQTSLIARLQPLVAPIMDNMYLDTYYFFVPTRLTWEHWKQFNGENTESKWIPETQYSIPQITAPTGGWQIGTIADYMGIPPLVDGISVSALPFRAYALICNEWFRDENNTDYLDIPFGDATVQGVNTGTFVTDVAKGGLPFKAAKYHDYFTSALPSPQKGPDVTIGLSGTAPVYGDGDALNFIDSAGTGFSNLIWKNASPTTADWSTTPKSPAAVLTKQLASANEITSGLQADLSASTSVTVNALRLAFATQRMYEKDARGGSRYVEMIKAHFGVTSPDARQQRPEYLGGNRVPININQVIQQSGAPQASTGGLSGDPTAVGRAAGYSVTSDVHGDFIKSFTEHGFVIGVCVVRYDHTYQQGIERFWSRRVRTDFYLPVFANLGEQPIYNKEIYAQGNDVDDEVFGYQEAWAEYRYKPSRVAGEMRSISDLKLDAWHLADLYSALPVLQSGWIFEDKSNLDRSLTVNSSVANQFIADFYVRCQSTRPMPLYSIPGLIDHH